MRKNVFLLCMSIMISCMVFELFVRIFFPYNPIPYRVNDEYIYMDGIGHLKRPFQNVSVIGECYEVANIRFNELGFRSVVSNTSYLESNSAADTSIGILGDSFMEAMQIPNGKETASLLQSRLGIRVLNMSIGGASLVKEYLIYTKLMSSYRPKVVLLFLYGENDITDSYCGSLNRKALIEKQVRSEACATIENGSLKINPAVRRSFKTPNILPPSPIGLSEKIKCYCHSCTMIFNMLRMNGLIVSKNAAPFEEMYETGYQFCLPELVLKNDIRDEVNKAWEVTEKILTILNKEVVGDRGKLILVLVPSYNQLSPTWKAEFKSLYGYSPHNEHDPNRIQLRLMNLAKHINIPVIDLLPIFLEYQRRFSLPYLSYRCDGHWNPIAHHLAASFVAEQLVTEHELVINKDKSTFIFQRRHEMNINPKEIIGEKNYLKIYKKGIYHDGLAQ